MSLPKITEATILQSYLLPPSPLPTILPYKDYLALVPTTYRNDNTYCLVLKRLYRDLQSQHSIALTQVQENIERECGAKAATLRATLARRIAIEEGNEGEDEERRKVRERRKRRLMGAEDEVAANDRSRRRRSNLYQSLDDAQIKPEDDEVFSSDDGFNNPLNLAAQEVMYNDPSLLHPAAHELPFDGENGRREGASAFHTEESLLRAMESASSALDKEVEELEAECARMKDKIKETVGGLSDLRYGKADRGRESGDPGEDGRGQYSDVLEALGGFRELMKARTAGVA